MSNPQDAEHKKSSNGQSPIAENTNIDTEVSNNNNNNDRQKQFHSKIATMIFFASLLIPFLWQIIWPDTTDIDLEVNRTSSGCPATWEELEKDTLENFQQGFLPTDMPLFILESIRGFEMAFLEEDSFYSFGYFLERTGNDNVTSTSWSTPLKRTYLKRLGTTSTRTVSYMHPVSNPLAPPMAQATKSQRLERYSRKAFLLQTFTEVRDVPMANCFVVEERLLVQYVKGNQLQVSAYFQIQFTKDTMFRSIITEQTSQEFEEYFDDYRSFLLAVATGQQIFWQPTDTSLKSLHEPPKQKRSKPNVGKKILLAAGKPLRPVMRQIGKMTRIFQNWKRNLKKKRDEEVRSVL